MGTEYPYRPPMRLWVRIPVVAFGLACLGISLQETWLKLDPELFLGSILVGLGWTAFGLYGGLPLVDTVQDWVPPTTAEEVTAKHLKGLRVMRIRGCFMVGFLFLGLPLWIFVDKVLQRLSLPDVGLGIMAITS